MNYPLLILLSRLLILLFLGLGFFADYKQTSSLRQLITKKDELITKKDEIIGLKNQTIEEMRKNIDIRKEKMGF